MKNIVTFLIFLLLSFPAKAKVKSRIILTPQHAKRLMKALLDNINKFENQHGEIKDVDPNAGIPMNFGGPTPMA